MSRRGIPEVPVKVLAISPHLDDAVLSAGSRIFDLTAGGHEVLLGCAITQLCETMEDEPVLEALRVRELVSPVLEIDGVDEVADELQIRHNLC